MTINLDKLFIDVVQSKEYDKLVGGWIVRVLGKGSDKSDYQITRVCEDVDFEGDTLTLAKSGRKIKRIGVKIHRYREGARKQKKEQHLWTSNSNSWASDYDDGRW